MEYKKISEIVTEKYSNVFLVTFNDGTKKKVRMWYDVRGVCIMNKKSRRYGHLLNATDNYDKWVSVVPYAKPEVDIYKRAIKRAKKIEKMLDESGLWENVKNMLHTFLYERTEEEQKAYLFYQKIDEKDAIFDRLIFEALTIDRCFKTISWYDYEKECYEKLLEERIRNKEEFKYSWHKGYDNCVELIKDNGRLLGYYSEEYTGCANGYYYILLDAKHALFYEKD